MRTSPSPDGVVATAHEIDERMTALRRSLLYTRKLILNSHQLLKQSRDVLRRADEQIRRVPRSEAK